MSEPTRLTALGLEVVHTPDISPVPTRLTALGLEVVHVSEDSPAVVEGTGSVTSTSAITGLGETPAIPPVEGTGAVSSASTIAGLGETPAVEPGEGTGQVSSQSAITGLGETPAVAPVEGTGAISSTSTITGLGETPGAPIEGTGAVLSTSAISGLGETPGDPIEDPDVPTADFARPLVLHLTNPGELELLIAPLGHQVTDAPMIQSERGYGGGLGLAGGTMDRSVLIETAWMDRDTDGAAHEAALTHLGSLWATGYMVDGLARVTVRGVRREQHRAYSYVRYTATLLVSGAGVPEES